MVTWKHVTELQKVTGSIDCTKYVTGLLQRHRQIDPSTSPDRSGARNKSLMAELPLTYMAALQRITIMSHAFILFY